MNEPVIKMRCLAISKDKLFDIGAVIAVTIITAVIYMHSLGNGFLMRWDDRWMVFNDYTTNFSWENTVNIFTTFYTGQYSPINQWIFSLIYHFWGFNPTTFHLLSLVLHIGCACLVGFIIGCFVNRKIAWIVALLFATHPLQVESVAWISASKILVYSFFYLLAIRFYIAYVRKGMMVYYLAVFLCFILSFGGKEQAVTLPVCLLVFDALLKRNFKDKMIWQEKIPLFLLAFFFAYVTLLSHASRGLGILTDRDVYPFFQRVAFGAYAYTEYIVKTILPVNLMFLYPFPIRIGAQLPWNFYIYPVGWIVVITVFYKYWLKPPLLNGMLYYTVLIALTLHVVPIERLAIVADRYIYLALPGLLFIMVYYIDHWIKQAGRWKKWLIGGAIIYMLALGFYSWHRSFAWESNEALKGKMRELIRQREESYKASKNEYQPFL